MTKFSGGNAGREIYIFPVQPTAFRIGNLTRLIHILAICVTTHSSIYGRVACSTLCTYIYIGHIYIGHIYFICVCCYSSRLVGHVSSISSIVFVVKWMEECTFSPSGMMFSYLVTRGWNFTSTYVIIHVINIRRHIERRHVNREEFRE